MSNQGDIVESDELNHECVRLEEMIEKMLMLTGESDNTTLLCGQCLWISNSRPVIKCASREISFSKFESLESKFLFVPPSASDDTEVEKGKTPVVALNPSIVLGLINFVSHLAF
jgi:hypothetical protein